MQQRTTGLRCGVDQHRAKFLRFADPDRKGFRGEVHTHTQEEFVIRLDPVRVLQNTSFLTLEQGHVVLESKEGYI